MITKAWKIYGAEGHRQRETFNKSYKYNFLLITIQELLKF